MALRLMRFSFMHLFAAMCLLVPGAAMSAVTFGFTMTALGDGAYTGRTYGGSFSYDGSVLTNVGEEFVDVNFGSLQVAFQFEGQDFDAPNDVNFDGYPLVLLFDGVPTFLDYKLVRGVNGVAFADSSVLEVLVQGELVSLSRTSGFDVVGSVTLVPEPASASLLALGLMTLIGLRRRIIRC